MAKRHRDLMARLDPVGLNRYQITEKDVRIVEHYISIIQKGIGTPTAWDDILHFGGYNGTSILIHEIVEIRALETAELKLRRQRKTGLRQMLEQNIEAHIVALYEEHTLSSRSHQPFVRSNF